jgi:hypothetical protein
MTFLGTFCVNQYSDKPQSFNNFSIQHTKNTPNCILYGELCRYPIDIFIKCRMIAFWQRIVCNRQDKIAAVLYKLLYNMHIQYFFHSK